MSAEHRLTATCYYPHPLKALPGPPDGETDHGFPDQMTIATEGGKLVVHVSAHEHYLAAIEAAAWLDLGALGDDMGRLGCSFYNNRWHSHPWGNFIGTRMNPIIPGRDFAHGYVLGWPYGTRMQVINPPNEIAGRIRGTMFRGCCFGSAKMDKEPDRVDLFMAEPCQFYGPIKARITYPWDGVSSKPVLGAQEALNRLGFKGANGKKLAEDDTWGRNTEHALKAWVYAARSEFAHGLPNYIHPVDSEIFFTLREIAKRGAR